jgi:hypothetical protein
MEVKCFCCQKNFDKAECEIKKTKNNFCSKSCAAKINNKLIPKRTVEGKCQKCQKPIPASRKNCKDCFKQVNATLGEIADFNGKQASTYAKIRHRARDIGKKLGWNKCVHCGYDKHIEIAHIKPINQFTKDTLISTINHPNNLIPLCPNCHWEFDNNQLTISGSDQLRSGVSGL